MHSQIVRLLSCSDEAGRIGWSIQTPECWRGTALFDDTRPLDEYTKDKMNYGPRADWSWWWSAPITKWTERRPTPARLIQLAFHDCLK